MLKLTILSLVGEDPRTLCVQGSNLIGSTLDGAINIIRKVAPGALQGKAGSSGAVNAPNRKKIIQWKTKTMVSVFQPIFNA